MTTLSKGRTGEAPQRSGVLRSERDRFVAFAFAVADVFFEIDPAHLVAYADGAVRWLTGRPADRLVGEPFLDLVAEDDRILVGAALAASLDQGRFGPFDVRFVRDGGRVRRTALSAAHLPGHGGSVFVAVRAARLPLAKEQENAVGRDSETGLLDKEEFSDLAGRALAAGREAEQPYKLTLLALDGVGQLRDRLGVDSAAHLLSEVAAYLNASSVGGASAGRLADGKFGLIHEPTIDREALRNGISGRASHADPSGQGVRVAATTMELEAAETSEVDGAKALLYTINKFSESRGDFTITELSQGYRLMLDETSRRLAAFKHMVAVGAFDALFQPIVELETREVHHYEALARLHETGPDASPITFIAFAEEVGVIADFDFAMCCKIVKIVEAARANGDDLRIAVNLSTRSLENAAFVDNLHRLLRSSGSARDMLMFEITESWKIRDLDTTVRVLRELRQHGNKVCLDDFGAGAAAFQYLRALEVDYVKIDGSYVRESLIRPNGMAFLRAMASLCRDLGIQTIGEMIETEDVAAFLRDVGVRFGQGYLFGRPAAGVRGVGRRAAH